MSGAGTPIQSRQAGLSLGGFTSTSPRSAGRDSESTAPSSSPGLTPPAHCWNKLRPRNHMTASDDGKDQDCCSTPSPPSPFPPPFTYSSHNEDCGAPNAHTDTTSPASISNTNNHPFTTHYDSCSSTSNSFEIRLNEGRYSQEASAAIVDVAASGRDHFTYSSSETSGGVGGPRSFSRESATNSDPTGFFNSQESNETYQSNSQVSYLPGGQAARLVSPESNSPPAHFTQLYQSQSGPSQQIFSSGPNSGEGSLCSQKAVAFLAGPRERICVMGSPIESCPRCRQEGFGSTAWRPHRHIGELKIRYICERHFDDLESNHHFDIPLCPLCNSVLYLYEFNALLGVSNARRLHKYVLKCSTRHVLPLLDLFCQTKKGGERCNANFKLQWCYGTMVKRCEAQKNRDHDLWWVRYKNEWKQRRTIIRYKKDFLSHLTDTQRGLLLGLGLEGEPPPDPKGTLGPTFDALISSAGGSPQGPKIKKRQAEKAAFSHLEESEFDGAFGSAVKRRHQSDGSAQQLFYQNSYNVLVGRGGSPRDQNPFAPQQYSLENVSQPNSNSTNKSQTYKSDIETSKQDSIFDFAQPDKRQTTPVPNPNGFPLTFAPNQVITGTPMSDLQDNTDGRSPVAVTVVGELCRSLLPSTSGQEVTSDLGHSIDTNQPPHVEATTDKSTSQPSFAEEAAFAADANYINEHKSNGL